MTPDEQVDGAIANAAAARLKQKRGKPVYMALGFHAPHYTLVAPKPFIDMYSPGDIELPRFPEDDLAHCPRRHSVFNTTDQKWLNDDEKREVIAAYYACISYVDYCVGKVMDALRESGREKDTFVVLWGDHGMHLGEHGLWRKATLFEEATRVPLIMAAPWLSSGGTPCTRPTELVDIYPTVADFAGIPALDILEGVSMRPLIEDPKRPWREAAFSWGGGPNHVTLRTERWRYTQHGRDSKNELFDHDADPGEFTNLAEKPEHVETVTELRKLLKAGAAPP